MLYTGAGSAAAVRLPAAPRLPHRHLLLAPLATVAVLAAAVLPSIGSGVARVGAPAARLGVLTAFSPGAHLAGLMSLPAAAQAPISAALGRDLAELTPSDGVGTFRHIGGGAGGGGEGGGGPGGAGDQFGWSVATSGHTVVVGAPYHRARSQADSGAVYVFQMPASGWASATQTAELTDSTLGAKKELGFSVAISSDGDTIVAGAPAGSEVPGDPNGVNTQGTVDVFTTTGRWRSTSTPAARLTVAGSPQTENTLGGELGWSVAISGHTIVAGAPYDPTYLSPGAVYVFNRPPGGWSGPQTQAAELTERAPPTNGNGFGSSVDISGNTIVIGAPRYAPSVVENTSHQHGAAFVFSGPWSGNRTQTATLTANNASPTSDDELGWSVAVSAKTIVAGAPFHTVGSNLGQGAAYVFVMPATGRWLTRTQTAELTAPEGQTGDEFGWSVAVSGHTIVAGALNRQIDGRDSQGASYVYTQPSHGWKTTNADTAELTASNGYNGDDLGASVAVSGATIVAGAPEHNAGSQTSDFGAAYVFGPGPAS